MTPHGVGVVEYDSCVLGFALPGDTLHQGGQPTPIDRGRAIRWDLIRHQLYDAIEISDAIPAGWTPNIEVTGHRLAT
jgi:hypothetical protein